MSGVNNVLVSANGTAFATINGVDWATYIDSYGYSVTNGNIGALSVTGAYQTGVGSYVAGNDVDVGASTANATDAPAANFFVNTLRFNAVGLTLALSGHEHREHGRHPGHRRGSPRTPSPAEPSGPASGCRKW